MLMKLPSTSALLFLFCTVACHAADYPTPRPVDVTLRDFRFAAGETRPGGRMHYRTLGEPQRDGQGTVRNAILILHGTTGDGEGFIRREFAGELFGPGQ